MASVFSKQAREGFRSTVVVKGDRLATVTSDRISVIDLGKETVTDIDLQKKQYSVITFADMARAMAALSSKANSKGSDVDFTFKADVKNTGASRAVNGVPTSQSILTITMEGTDKKSGEKVNMIVSSDMWVTSSVSGYDEVQSFYARMAQKMAFNPTAGFLGAMMAQQPGMSKGFSEMAKEASKINGVPVIQVMRMSAAGAGMPTEAQMAQAQQAQSSEAQAPQQEQPAVSASEAAGAAAAGAASGRSGRLGGIAAGLGGFGGFGRRKKQQEEAQQQTKQQPERQAQPSAPASQGATPPGVFMELTTELTSFSPAPVDASKFEVPPGFKQVEHDMAKQLK
jgi:hypothetical protein